MSKQIYTTIIGSGSYIPDVVVKNEDFLKSEFFDSKTRTKLESDNSEIIEKFKEITNIEERRWAREDQTASHLAVEAAKDALQSSGVDPESLDFIICAHNFGNVDAKSQRAVLLPYMASYVKQILNIENPATFAFDVMAGCPGWVQAMIVADSIIKGGTAKRGLVVGADTNSRVGDPHDRDLMIFADGAGAVIVEARESEEPIGVLSHSIRVDAISGANYLLQGPSLNPDFDQDKRYIRMMGHKVYIYALQNVPGVVKDCLDKAGLQLSDIKKILIHQANEKMDEAICQRVMRLYKMSGSSKDIMPMTIGFLGNTSAATIPTLYDLIKKGKLDGHKIESGDHIVMTSVGAGMNINAIAYREI